MLLRKPSAGWMLVGLGNPGPKYARSRHNVGFRAVDALCEQQRCRCDRLRLKALTGFCELGGQKVLLVKPMTYMNLSGQAVRPLADYYKIPPERILVIFDDISLPVGRLRVRPDGSAGGHNGVKSLIAELGTQDFPRVKVGVGAKPHPDYDLADWVLSRFSAEDEVHIRDAVANAAGAVETLLSDGVEAAASRYNGK